MQGGFHRVFVKSVYHRGDIRGSDDTLGVGVDLECGHWHFRVYDLLGQNGDLGWHFFFLAGKLAIKNLVKCITNGLGVSIETG